MTLQSFFLFGILHNASKHDFLYLSLHLSKWNESKLPMFLKIYKSRRIFKSFLKNDFCVAQATLVEIFHKQVVISFNLHNICK